MIRITLLLTFLTFNLTSVFCQYKTWFEDNFDDKSKTWYWSDIDSPEMTRKISDGKYYINHKDTKGMIYWTLTSIYSHPEKPFLLESDMMQTEGNNANGFGLILSGKNNKYYYFLINPLNKSYWVGSEQKGTWKTYNSSKEPDGWSKSNEVNKQNIYNNLKVHHSEGKVRFLISDKEVFSSAINPDFTEMPGATYWGIVSCTNMKIEVDKFVLYQDNPTLNVVADLPKLTKVNLGSNVNTKYTEKWPYIAPDGKTLYYNVQGDPENKGADKTDEIYYSVALTDSTWGKRQNPGWPLNNEWPNCVISATPDNNTLYLMHTYNSDGTPKGSGFSMTTKTANGWSVPVDLKVKNYYNNGSTNEFCFSADRKVLLMAIRRDDSFGDNDIYASFLQDNGEFSEPKNLGNQVNTFAWESSPFLAPDGVTLYYSTAGYPGFGDADIFMTRRLDSTWTKWSTPQNMGPDINSSDWEAYYTVAASGKYAYVVSRQNGIEGSLDLFRVKLPEVLKPQPVALIYGKVLNSKTQEPLESTINYNILSTNKEVGIASSNSKDGSYKIILPVGEVYSFLAKKKDFYSVSENIDVSNLKEYTEIERNLYLAPLEVGETIRLNNLFFDFNKFNLRKESFPELGRVIRLLNDNPQMIIEIAGHTDNVGSDEVNNKLSHDRAASVKNYLLEKGIAPERIVSKGYGKTKPVASNNTDEGRQENRRVEFTILKN